MNEERMEERNRMEGEKEGTKQMKGWKEEWNGGREGGREGIEWNGDKATLHIVGKSPVLTGNGHLLKGTLVCQSQRHPVPRVPAAWMAPPICSVCPPLTHWAGFPHTAPAHHCQVQ